MICAQVHIGCRVQVSGLEFRVEGASELPSSFCAGAERFLASSGSGDDWCRKVQEKPD